MAKSKPPVKKFKVGRVNATIWRNKGEKGEYLTANFDRRYKDGDDWKSISSFSATDLPDLIMAVQMTQGYMPIIPSEDAEEE